MIIKPINYIGGINMATRRTLAIIIALTLILGGMVFLSGCSEKVQEFELTESEVGGIVAISAQEDFIDGYVFDQYILYDPDTLVMYVMIHGGKGASMSILYNVDGTPKLYNPEK